MPQSPTPSTTTQIGPIAAIVAFAVSKGLPLHAVEKTSGLTLTDLVQPNVRVSDEVAIKLMRMMSQHFSGEGIALQVAKAAPLSYFGPVRQAVECAEDLRSMVESAVRYAKILSSGVEMEIIEGPEFTAVSLHHPFDDYDPLEVVPEVTMGLWVRHLRQLGMADGIARVEFMHQPCAPAEMYAELFGVEVLFGQPRHALVFKTERLDQPSAAADRCTYGMHVGHLEVQREQLVGRSTSAQMLRIREAVTTNARRGEFGAEPLARKLGMSLRTLERQARSNGTTVRRLLDEARERHARRLLGDPKLAIEEVASRVGYSAESAFRRAFKRWSGMSPTEFRRTRSGLRMVTH